MKMLICRFFNAYLLIGVIANIQDLTLVVQNANRNSYESTCVIAGNSTYLAVDWITDISSKIIAPETQFVPSRDSVYNCDISKKQSCNQYWVTEGEWSIKGSLTEKLRPVLDRRWEKFESTYTEDSSFKTIVTLEDEYLINLSVRGMEGHLYLCDSYNPSKSNCYWMIINGWSGRITGIRKCMYGTIPASTWPSGDCAILRQNNSASPFILEKSRWTHFTLLRNYNRILLFKVGDKEPILNYTDTAFPFMAQNLIVRSKGPAYWKLHNYEYTSTTSESITSLGPQIRLSTNSFHASAFVAMCKGCTLAFEVVHQQQGFDVVDSRTDVFSPSRGEWKEIRINAMDLDSENIFIRVSTICEGCKKPFWAIDDFQVCAEKEIRLIKSKLQLNEVVCELVKTSEQIRYDGFTSMELPEVSCPIGTFGNTCENCDGIFPSNCDKSIMCTMESTGKNICRCSPGYTGDKCDQKCPAGFYGVACQKQCGYCEYTPCNFVTGACQPVLCLYDFRGNDCKTPPLPVLRVPPAVLEVNYTSCVVQLQNISYLGNLKPSYYKIQYKLQSGQKWTTLEQYRIDYQDPIRIPNLEVVTTYNIRAILVMDDGRFYEMESVPKTSVTTTCAFVENHELNLDVSNISATLTFQSHGESCRSFDYRVWINDTLVPRSDSYQFNFTNLKPFTNYELVVRNFIRNKTLRLNFETKEGAPSKVLNVKTRSDSTSITVLWDSPQFPNGMIRYYNIRYQHVSYRACQGPTMNESDLVRYVTVYNNSTTLQKLQPYSQYALMIVPVTVMEGEASDITVLTEGTEIPEENEVPSIRQTATSSTFVDVSLSEPNCAQVKGTIVLHVYCQCFDSWCPKTALFWTYVNFDYKYPLRIKSLFPFTNYDINIKIGRTSEKSDGSGVLTKVTTLSSVPNSIGNIVVYSKNQSSVSIRFPPPFPPTGILEQFRTQHCYPRSLFRSDVCDETYSPAMECSLWSNLQCVTIHRLEPETGYYFEISARNNNTVFGGVTKFNAVTIVEPPTAPLNFTADWDDYYNLTLNWVHPSQTNGVLRSFTFQIFKEQMLCKENVFPITEDKYQKSYELIIEIRKECYSSVLDVYSWANNAYKGYLANIRNLLSPPVTPSFVEEPKITSIKNTTMSVDLQGLIDFENNSLLYILITSPTSTMVQSDYVEDIWKKAGISKTSATWIAAEYNYIFLNRTSKVVSLGSGGKHQSPFLQREIHNRELAPVTDYIVTILLMNTFMELERHSVYEITTSTIGLIPEPLTDVNSALFALLLLLVLPFIIWFVVHKLRNKKDITWNTLVTMVNTENGTTDPDIIPLATNERRHSKELTKKRATMINSVNQQTTSEMYSKPIKIMEFENYVKESILNGELARQHQLFPRGQTKPWDYGILPQNKSKNRYNNLIAYDHTRVKLEKINNDEFSDYINANYVEGYSTPKAYIATQGPKPSTVNDFWRMIWQENVHYIVMLANVIEGGKKKSEQYWPNINERIAYANIQVLYSGTQVFADYEYRMFSVQCGNEVRKIEHLHFTSWPDHGVPLYCQSLVPFLRKMLTIPQGSSPIVVHCSAGVGRTGTIILSDLCLRMAAREGVVDVLKHQRHIREQRVNMVDNLEQYKLVHLVLLECLIAPQTSFICDETIERSIAKVLETDTLQHHMEYLDNTDWQDYAMQSPISLEIKPQWALKNRFQDIVPSGVGRIYLTRYPVTDEHSDYINAVEVDGFKAPQRFIATQQPLPHTVCDFWRMIDDKEVITIISLNKIDKEDKTSCVFWPSEKHAEIKPVPYITLFFQNKSKKEFFNVVTMILKNTKGKKPVKRTIHLISLKQWSSKELVPENKEALIAVWEEMENVTRGNENPIVVSCYDGVTACGLYLSLAFLIEKIKLEQQCDVCLAVRTVRHNRKNFVTKKEQFIFLYKTALVYLSAFELYSNFNSILKN